MSVAVVKTERQALIFKPPEDIEKVFQRAEKEYGLRVRLTYVPLDLGRTAVIAAGANAKYLAELIGITYDNVELHPRSHPKNIADVMFYKDNRVVAKVQVHLCYDSTRIKECITTMKRKVKRDEYYVLITAAEFRKTKDGPFERGMFLFLMTYEYLRRNTAEAIWEDMLEAVDMLRDNLGYHELYITGFIDKYITLSWLAEFAIKDLEESIQHIENTMATKEDIAKIRSEMATKEDLEEVRSKMATKEDIAKIRSEMATKEDLEEVRSYLERRIDELEVRLSRIEGNILKLLDALLKSSEKKNTD